MALAVSDQLWQLALFAALGLGLGLLYDLAWLLRRGLRGAWLWDALYVLAAALVLFSVGLQTAEGSLRGYMPIAALGGLLVWRAGVSRFARRGLDKAWTKAENRLRRWAAPVVKRGKTAAKKLF